MSLAVEILHSPVFAVIETTDATAKVEVQTPVTLQVEVLGIQGASGLGLTLSADAGNILAAGSDGGLFVPAALSADGGLDLTLIFDNQLI